MIRLDHPLAIGVDTFPPSERTHYETTLTAHLIGKDELVILDTKDNECIVDYVVHNNLIEPIFLYVYDELLSQGYNASDRMETWIRHVILDLLERWDVAHG